MLLGRTQEQRGDTTPSAQRRKCKSRTESTHKPEFWPHVHAIYRSDVTALYFALGRHNGAFAHEQRSAINVIKTAKARDARLRQAGNNIGNTLKAIILGRTTKTPRAIAQRLWRSKTKELINGKTSVLSDTLLGAK